MKLTKNEKKILNILLQNSRSSDSKIAEMLKISSVAVGKIRKKLETTLINSYTLNLDYEKLGIKTFALAFAKMTPKGLNFGELEIEEKLLKDPSIIQVYRIPKGSSSHIILYGFLDLTELDNFFHSSKKKEELHKFIENQEIFTFSHNSLIKNSPIQLFQKVINDLNKKNNSPYFNPSLTDK